MEQATDQAARVLNRAQQLADSLIDEAMQAAHDLLLTARSRQRDIMEQAKAAARELSDEPWPSNAPAARTLRCATSSTSGCSPRWRSLQFQAVLDAFNDAAPAVLTVADLGGGVSR
jgi:hypothetical protein